ncbi:hypothetical protein TrRE_jg11869, partial [Triparma retinervis]
MSRKWHKIHTQTLPTSLHHIPL